LENNNAHGLGNALLLSIQMMYFILNNSKGMAMAIGSYHALYKEFDEVTDIHTWSNQSTRRKAL
jgi:hypothetical protein